MHFFAVTTLHIRRENTYIHLLGRTETSYGEIFFLSVNLYIIVLNIRIQLQ